MNADQLENIAAFLHALDRLTSEYGLGVVGELFDNDKIIDNVEIAHDVEYRALIGWVLR